VYINKTRGHFIIKIEIQVVGGAACPPFSKCTLSRPKLIMWFENIKTLPIY
jgi:hypothetical protein